MASRVLEVPMKTNVYNIIPPDYLVYSEVCKEYSVVSDEEVLQMCDLLRDSGFSQEDMSFAITKICELKLGGIIYDRILKNQISVSLIDGELAFKA